MPDSLEIIGDSAFADCISLKSVTIPEQVSKIGSSAFARCTSLVSIDIPASVVEIDTNAFRSSDKLEIVRFAGSEAEWLELGGPNLLPASVEVEFGS